MEATLGFLFGFILVFPINCENGQELSQLATGHRHYLQGSVFIKDQKTIEIRNFSYPSTKKHPNGRLGPDAFFIAGKIGCRPDDQLNRGNITGIVPLPYPKSGQKWNFEDQSIPIMSKAVDKTILLTLPPGVNMSELKWLSLWCRRYRSNFGQVLLSTC